MIAMAAEAAAFIAPLPPPLPLPLPPLPSPPLQPILQVMQICVGDIVGLVFAV